MTEGWGLLRAQLAALSNVIRMKEATYFKTKLYLQTKLNSTEIELMDAARGIKQLKDQVQFADHRAKVFETSMQTTTDKMQVAERHKKMREDQLLSLKCN